jgi:hypothetical protein
MDKNNDVPDDNTRNFYFKDRALYRALDEYLTYYPPKKPGSHVSKEQRLKLETHSALLQTIPMQSLLESLKDSAVGLDHLGHPLEKEFWVKLGGDSSRTLYGISKGVSLTYEGPYRADDRKTVVEWTKKKSGNLKARLEKECGNDWSTVTYGNPAVVYYSDTYTKNAKIPGKFIHTIKDNMQALQDRLEQDTNNDMEILVQRHQWRHF